MYVPASANYQQIGSFTWGKDANKEISSSTGFKIDDYWIEGTITPAIPTE
jgi:hypothetical protein